MICPNCNNEIQDGRKFCPKCGKSLPGIPQVVSCAQCGGELRSGRKFCPSCGALAQDILIGAEPSYETAEPIAAPKPPPVAPENPVTVQTPAAYSDAPKKRGSYFTLAAVALIGLGIAAWQLGWFKGDDPAASADPATEPTLNTPAAYVASSPPAPTPIPSPDEAAPDSAVIAEEIVKSFDNADRVFELLLIAGSTNNLEAFGFAPDSVELEKAKSRGLAPEGVLTSKWTGDESQAADWTLLYIHAQDYKRYQVRYSLNGLTPEEAMEVYREADRHMVNRYGAATIRAWQVGAEPYTEGREAFNESLMHAVFAGREPYAFTATHNGETSADTGFTLAFHQYDGEDYLTFQVFVPTQNAAAFLPASTPAQTEQAEQTEQKKQVSPVFTGKLTIDKSYRKHSFILDKEANVGFFLFCTSNDAPQDIEWFIRVRSSNGAGFELHYDELREPQYHQGEAAWEKAPVRLPAGTYTVEISAPEYLFADVMDDAFVETGVEIAYSLELTVK